MKNLFVFSWCHLWSMKAGVGAPSYHHTINYYINSDKWNVWLFTADRTNMELDGRAHVYLFSFPEIIERICGIPKLGYPFRTIKYWCYTYWACMYAKRIIKNLSGKSVAYAYEFWGVKAANMISKRFNIPLVTRFQGTFLMDKKDRWRDRFCRYPEYSAITTKADLIVMTNDGTQGDIVLKRLKNFSTTLFLRNGLDLYDKYESMMSNVNCLEERNKLGLSDRDKICMTASRLVDWKRVDRAIYALSEVLKKEPHAKLIIAGDGTERTNLEKLVKKLNLERAVIFLGSVPHDILYKYMLMSDVFLSLYDLTNLGNPTFEAMLMKRAIITLNNGGTNTVIQNEKNGILLNLDQLDQLPDKIIELFINEEKREKLAEEAFDYAKRNFYSWDTRLKLEADVINGL